MLHVLARHDDRRILAVEFGRESIHLLLLRGHAVILIFAHHTSRNHVLALLLMVENTLVAKDVGRAAEIVGVELDRRWRHLLVHDLGEERNVTRRVSLDTLNEANFARGREMLHEVRQLNFENFLLSVRDGLKARHVLQSAVDGVASRSILIAADEVGDFPY